MKSGLIQFVLIILGIITFVNGDAIIGNGEVILGVNEYADLNVPYNDVLGMPTTDPLDIQQVGLRTGNGDDAGDYAAIEEGIHIIYIISYIYHIYLIIIYNI